MDKFEQLFRLQHDLQTDVYGYNFQRMLPADRITYIKEMYIAAGRELGEALDETGWKPWATSQHINRDAYIGELVDVLHFLMNMFLAIGDDPEELAREVFTRYGVKRRINAQRQVDGYDSASAKCPLCKRALDDPAVGCRVAQELDGVTTNGFCMDIGREYTLGYLELQRDTV